VTGRDDMTEDERALLEHRAAIRSNVAGVAGHVARSARWLAQRVDYARLPQPTVERVAQCAEVLEAIATAIAGRIDAERAERDRLGMDRASYQRRLERAAPSDQ